EGGGGGGGCGRSRRRGGGGARPRAPLPAAPRRAAAARAHAVCIVPGLAGRAARSCAPPEPRGLSAARECNVIEVVLSTNRHNRRPERRSHHGAPLRLVVLVAPRCAAPIALLGKRANAGTP